MKKILVAAALLLGALSSQAQEKVVNVIKTDGTNAQTRLADVKHIGFLTSEDTTMIMKLTNGAAFRTEVSEVEEITFADTTYNLNSSGFRILFADTRAVILDSESGGFFFGLMFYLHENLVIVEHRYIRKIKRLNILIINIAVFIFVGILQEMIPPARFDIRPETSFQGINAVLEKFPYEHETVVVKAVAFYEFISLFIAE